MEGSVKTKRENDGYIKELEKKIAIQEQKNNNLNDFVRAK